MEREMIKNEEIARMDMRKFFLNISKQLNINNNVLTDYIFAMLSVGLVRNSEVFDQFDKIYDRDKLRYYNAVEKASAAQHILLQQGRLADEIKARRIMGIILCAENNIELRNKILKIMRKSYPMVFNSVKKLNNEGLKNKYLRMDDATRKAEAKFDAALYFYFSMYCFPDAVDQMHILAIIKDIVEFDSSNPLTADIEKEIARYKDSINKIKSLLQERYGKTVNFLDALYSNKKLVAETAEFFEMLMVTNKIDINHLFVNSQFVNIDRIILAFIKSGYKAEQYDLVMINVIAAIFMQSLTKEYLDCRKLYFDNCQERLYLRLSETDDKNEMLRIENKELSSQIKVIQNENYVMHEELKIRESRLLKAHKGEVALLEAKIKELERELQQERENRKELSELRNYAFEIQNEYIPQQIPVELKVYLEKLNVLIVGGPKEWRRKIREKYPELKTLNGFNENFEIRLLNNSDCVFFYTGYMSHATYTRAVAFIRNKQIKFGYIGKTNIELVEEEIKEQLAEYYGEYF